WLSGHPLIQKVIYVGLPSHPQHALAKKQMRGFTGMLCIEVAGADEQEQFSRAQALLNGLKLFSNAVSLGGVESLIAHPASMWGVNHTAEQRKKSGMTAGLLRISVGIEHIDDLIADFEQALV